MLKLRSVTAGAIATAMLATSVTPAMAQGYPGGYGGGYGRPTYGGGYGGGYRRHRDHDDTGAIVAGVIGVGILAAIIASASSNKTRSTNGGYATNSGYGNIRTDDAAADACASAAEQQLGGSARVSAVTAVDRVSDGYNVRGNVDYGRGSSSRNDSWRNNGNYDQRSFSCSVRYGNVARVDFGG
ncbi:hypothetical protein [Sphingomonas sp. SUN039]|uniref:hypothetical protein n=1 Tax=Sphingomonas sp. SUN039 TaxID=2937787 RepID=UPI0021644D05|nr:hypothetical protein [Sphingomonas sp. SUN039]UVO54500.1 hypothetical protein M0209_10330 [Sphingomonas sp. SUN039]